MLVARPFEAPGAIGRSTWPGRIGSRPGRSRCSHRPDADGGGLRSGCGLELGTGPDRGVPNAARRKRLRDRFISHVSLPFYGKAADRRRAASNASSREDRARTGPIRCATQKISSNACLSSWLIIVVLSILVQIILCQCRERVIRRFVRGRIASEWRAKQQLQVDRQVICRDNSPRIRNAATRPYWRGADRSMPLSNSSAFIRTQDE